MKKFAVIGNPIHHSLSPTIHAQFAKQVGLSMIYEQILAPLNGFNVAAKNFISSGALGFNITVPFKVEAYDLADEHTLNANTAGAVNTIKVENGSLYGENTDGIGLVNDLCNNLHQSIKGKDILILGAGGATQGILLPLLECQPERILVANRTKARSLKLASNYSEYGKVCGFGLDQIKAKPVDIIINATSASLDGKTPEIPPGVATGALCYDLMYGRQTPFMQWARKNSAVEVTDGLGMLVEQAASAFAFWHGKTPETKEVLKSLRETID
jgi:shikimate dehydrogenase